MTKIELTPQHLDELIDVSLLRFIEMTGTHLRCICNKKMHKNCPKHNFLQMAKVVYDNRDPIGDKILNLQSKKIITPIYKHEKSNTA